MNRKSFPVSLKAVHAIIGVSIMLLFPHLPFTLPKVTPVGMEILGIFIGTLYLWTTVDPVWASLLSIFMVGVSSYAPMGQVLQSAFGAPVVVQMFFLMIVMNCLVHNRLTAYIGRFFLTLKINNGRPWVFSAMLMFGSMLMSAFIGPFSPIFLFWPVLYDIFQDIGMKKGDKYPTIMVILVAFGAMLGFPVPPYSGNSLALLNNFSTITENMGNKVVVNNASYMFLAILHAVIALVVIILFCKFVLRPDVSKLKNLDVEKLKKNPLPPLNNNQKFMAVTFILYILSMLLPSILPKTGFIGFLSQNSYGIAIGYTAVLACVNLNKGDSTPVLPFGKVMSNFAWPTFFLCTSAILLGNVLTNESTGISAFLNVIFRTDFPEYVLRNLLSHAHGNYGNLNKPVQQSGNRHAASAGYCYLLFNLWHESGSFGSLINYLRTVQRRHYACCFSVCSNASRKQGLAGAKIRLPVRIYFCTD